MGRIVQQIQPKFFDNTISIIFSKLLLTNLGSLLSVHHCRPMQAKQCQHLVKDHSIRSKPPVVVSPETPALMVSTS